MPSSAGSAPPCPPSARLLYCQAVPLGGRGEVFAVAGVVREAAAVWAGGLHSGWNARRMRFDRRSPPSLHCCWWKIYYLLLSRLPPSGGRGPSCLLLLNLIACVCCCLLQQHFWPREFLGGARGRAVAWGDDGWWSTLAGLVARA